MNSLPHQPNRSAAHIIPRALLGLACLLSPAPAVLCAAGERVDIVEEMHKFFGNWLAPGLILGFVVFFPLFGVYLIVEAIARYRHSAKQA